MMVTITKDAPFITKIIIDKKLIKELVGRDDSLLIIQYNKRFNRYWFQTESMEQRERICPDRIKSIV